MVPLGFLIACLGKPHRLERRALHRWQLEDLAKLGMRRATVQGCPRDLSSEAGRAENPKPHILPAD